MKEKIILFDLDGTLIDSTEAILDSFKKSYESLNLPYPGDDIVKEQVGHPLPDMFASLGLNQDLIDLAVKRYKENYRRVHTTKTVLIDGAKEAVERAYSFAKLAVVTTKTGKYSIELLQHFGLLKYFEVVIGSEDVKYHKPHPEPIITALKKMNTTPSESVYMIGDTCMDMESAKSANIKSIAVEFIYEDIDRLKECSTIVYKNVKEAVEYIYKL